MKKQMATYLQNRSAKETEGGRRTFQAEGTEVREGQIPLGSKLIQLEKGREHITRGFISPCKVCELHPRITELVKCAE